MTTCGAWHELGYLPDKTHTRTLGLAVTTDHPASWGFAEIPYFSQAIQSATVVAHEHGYGLVVQPTALGLERLAVLPVDGMLLIDSPKGDRVRADLLMRGVPVVHIGRPVSAEPNDIWVDNDVEGAVRGVLDHLSQAGAQRVALLGGDTTDYYIQACMTTYRQWCAERGEPALLELMRRKNPALPSPASCPGTILLTPSSVRTTDAGTPCCRPPVAMACGFPKTSSWPVRASPVPTRRQHRRSPRCPSIPSERPESPRNSSSNSSKEKRLRCQEAWSITLACWPERRPSGICPQRL